MDRRVKRTKHNIYSAFFQLLKTKSMDEISITELSALADIDRRTFYKHYDTVIDVYNEFKQQLEDRLFELLHECESEDGEFDFNHLFNGLQTVMEDNLEFYEKLSNDQSFMFLRYDCKEILESALKKYYRRDDNEFSAYASFVSYAITGYGSDYLTQKTNTTYSNNSKYIVNLLRKIWLKRA